MCSSQSQVERHDAVHRFRVLFPLICFTLEHMSLSADIDAKTRMTARGHLRNTLCPVFCNTLVLLNRVLKLTQPLSVQLQVVTFKSVNHNVDVGTVLYKQDITKCLLWNFRRLKKGKFFSPSLWISWLPWILLGMFSMFWTAGTTRTGTLYTTRRAIYSLWKIGLDLEEKMLQENPEFEGGILS